MRRYLIGLCLLLVVLFIVTALATYESLKSGGYLERKIAKLVEEQPGDKFSFNGITPHFDFSLTIDTPSFSRENLQVAADSVVINPNYVGVITGNPAADSFSVVNGQLKKDKHNVTNLAINGSCPQMKNGLVLEGKLLALISSPTLGSDEYSLEANFALKKEELTLSEMKLTDSNGGQAKGQLRHKRSPKGEELEGKLDFGDKGPTFGQAKLVTAQPLGVLDFSALVNNRKALHGNTLKLPLAGTGLTVKTPKGVFTLKLDKGKIDLRDGSLLLDSIEMKSSAGGTLTIGGGVQEKEVGNPTISIFAKGASLPLPAFLPFASPSVQKNLATLSPKSSLDVSASINGALDSLKGSINITPRDLSLEVPVAENMVPVALVHGGLRLKLFGTPQRTTVHASIEPPAALEVAGAICACSGLVKDVTKKKTLALSLSATDIQLSDLLALAPNKVKKKISSFSPRGSLTFAGKVLGNANKPEPDITITPQNLALQLPIKDGTLPVELKKGELHLFGSDLQIKTMVLETLKTPINFSGKITGLDKEQKLALSAKITKAKIKEILAGLPKSLKPDLGKTKGHLGGSLAKAVLSIGGTFKEPHVYGWMDVSGLRASHSSLKRFFQMNKGRISLQSTGDGQWKDVNLSLGKVLLLTKGKYLNKKLTDAHLKVILPLPEVPLLLGLQKSVKLSGSATLDGTLTGEPATIVATGTLIAPKQQTLAFVGAKRPFYVDSANLRSAWRFDGKSGELSLPAVGASFLGGQLAAKAKLSVISDKPKHWFKMLLKGVDLNRLMTRGANRANLLSGIFTCNSETNVYGNKGLESAKGDGFITVKNMAINGGTMVDISGWDKLFPSPTKKHRSIGRALLHGLAEVLIEKSNNKALKGYAAIREVLRRQHRFGTLTAKVKVDKGMVTIAPISTTGSNSKLQGYMSIRVKDLVLNGMFTGELIYENKHLKVNDIAVKGTASSPQFKLTKSVLDTFVMTRTK